MKHSIELPIETRAYNNQEVMNTLKQVTSEVVTTAIGANFGTPAVCAEGRIGLSPSPDETDKQMEVEFAVLGICLTFCSPAVKTAYLNLKQVMGEEK